MSADTAKLNSKINWRVLSDEDWRARLPLDVFQILRLNHTEKAYSSELIDEDRRGSYHCAGCQTPLFLSDMKFKTHSGWPGFSEFLPNALEMQVDFKLAMPRLEYHCLICGGHQGHVFDDGANATGLRYCNNGRALIFKPEDRS